MSLFGKVPVAPTDPKPENCGRCDFSMGSRGGDRCSPCNGTGSVFRVAGVVYPNTREGYIEACKAKGVEPVLE